MTDVSNKTCEKCNVRPSYGYKKDEPATRCAKHIEKTMFNVVDKLCEIKECITRASFGKEEKKPTHCDYHNKLLDLGLKNVVSKVCLKCNDKQPVYGKPGFELSHCVQCRELGMIRRSKTKCKKCKAPAIYGKNLVSLHCEEHKEEDEMNYVEKPCKSCKLPMILDKDETCEFCNPETFKRVHLAKQKGVIEYIDSKTKTYISKDVKITTDIMIDKGICGKERPDRIYEFKDKVLCFECDEEQHRHITCDCEMARMINITNTFGGLPVYFIRWNPDSYKTEGKVETLKQRYQKVENVLLGIMKEEYELPNSLLSVCYMYYDGWNGREIWESIIEFEKEENF
jgi:hypothetical protein